MFGNYKAHCCPHGIGEEGFCIYHDHDDEVCCQCIKDVISELKKELKSIKHGK